MFRRLLILIAPLLLSTCGIGIGGGVFWPGVAGNPSSKVANLDLEKVFTDQENLVASRSIVSVLPEKFASILPKVSF